MEEQLTKFTEAVLGLTPRVAAPLFGELPRMGGTWSGTQGSSSGGGGNVLIELKHHTADFRAAYLARNATAYNRIAQDIEGLLLVSQTLSILNDAETMPVSYTHLTLPTNREV